MPTPQELEQYHVDQVQKQRGVQGPSTGHFAPQPYKKNQGVLPGLTEGRRVAGKMDMIFRAFDIFGNPTRRAGAALASGGGAGDVTKAFIKGLGFSDYYSGEQMYEEVTGNDARWYHGLASEILTDPLTWIPVGLIGKAVKGTKTAVKAGAVRHLGKTAKGRAVLKGADLFDARFITPVKRYTGSHIASMRGMDRRMYNSELFQSGAIDDMAVAWLDSNLDLAREFVDEGLIKRARLFVENAPDPKKVSQAERFTSLDNLFNEPGWNKLKKADGDLMTEIAQAAEQLTVSRDPRIMSLIKNGSVDNAFDKFAQLNIDARQYFDMEAHTISATLDSWAQQFGPEARDFAHLVAELPKERGYLESMEALESLHPDLRKYVEYHRLFYDEYIPGVKQKFGIDIRTLGGEDVMKKYKFEAELARSRVKGRRRVLHGEDVGALGAVERQISGTYRAAGHDAIAAAQEELARHASQKDFFSHLSGSLDQVDEIVQGNMVAAGPSADMSDDAIELVGSVLPRQVSDKEVMEAAISLRNQKLDMMDNLEPEKARLLEFMRGKERFLEDPTHSLLFDDIPSAYKAKTLRQGANYKRLDEAAREFGYEDIANRAQRGISPSGARDQHPVEMLLDDMQELIDNRFTRKNPKRAIPSDRLQEEARDQIMAFAQGGAEPVFEGDTMYGVVNEINSVFEKMKATRTGLIPTPSGQGRSAIKDMADRARFAAEQASAAIGDKQRYLDVLMDPVAKGAGISPAQRSLIGSLTDERLKLQQAIHKKLQRVMAETDPLTNPSLQQLNENIANSVQYVRRLLTPEARESLNKNKAFRNWLHDSGVHGKGTGGEWNTVLMEHIQRKFDPKLSSAHLNAMAVNDPAKFVDLLGGDGIVREQDIADWLVEISGKKGNEGLFITDLVSSYAAYQEGLGRVVAAKEFLHGVKQFGMTTGARDSLLEQYPRLAKWANPKNGYKELEGWVFPPDLTRYINHHAENLADDTVLGRWNRMYQKTLNMWKGTVLARPGYHVRNKGNDMFVAAVYGGMKDQRRYKQALEIQQSFDPAVFELFQKGGRAPYKLTRGLKLIDHVPEHKLKGYYTTVDGRRITKKELGQKMREMGVTAWHGMAAVEADQLVRPGTRKAVTGLQKAGDAYMSGLDYNRLLGTINENNTRAAYFLDQVIKGKSYDEARDLVGELFFDYDLLSPEQKQIKKYLIPFFTWRLKNAHMQTRMMGTKSKMYNAMVKTVNALERKQEPGAELTPEWIRENTGIKTRDMPDGTKRYFLLGSWIGYGDMQQMVRSFGLQWDASSKMSWHMAKDIGSNVLSDMVVESNPAIRNVLGQMIMNFDPWREGAVEDPDLEDYGGDIVSFAGRPMRKDTVAMMKWLPQLSFWARQADRVSRGVRGAEQKEPITAHGLAGEMVGLRTYPVDERRQYRFKKYQFEETEWKLKSKLKGALNAKDKKLANEYRKQIELLYARKKF